MADVKRLGNLYGDDRGTGFAGNVWDKDALSPTITTAQGGMREPMVVEDYVMEGNFNQCGKVHSENGICRTITGGSSHCGNEPKVLVKETNPIRMVRTEEGKVLRKAYESGEIHHGFNEHRKAEIKEDGICNTISTVEKDTLVCEKTTIENFPCSFDKSAGGRFVGMQDASIKDVGKVQANCITSRYYKGIESDNANAVIVASRGRNPDNPSDRTAGNPIEQRLEPNSEGICNCLTSVQKDNMVLETRQLGYIEHGTGKHQSNTVYDEKGLSPAITTINGGGTQQIKICEENKTVKIGQATKQGYVECEVGGVADLSFPNSTTRRGRVEKRGQICPTITAESNGLHRVETVYRIRKLTPLECWRLMDFSDEDFHKAAFEIRDIKEKWLCNAKLKDVIEKQSLSGSDVSVLNITNALKELGVISTEWMKFQEKRENEKEQYVDIVIEKLEKTEPSGCVTNITKCIESTEMLCTLMEELDRHHTAIIGLGEKGKQNTGKCMRIILEENLHRMNLFTILTLLKLTIESKIFTSTVQKVSIQGFMQNYENCGNNMVKMRISDLRMEGIFTRVSNTNLYKQAGNSIVCAVLCAIFSQLGIEGVGKWNDRKGE